MGDELRAAPVRIPPRAPAARPGPRHVRGLDGLRAIAVLAVLAYHLDLTWADGGFLGVEVFFTLSGFLVTGLLAAELARRGRVDVPGFYRARGRRLVPALVVCVLGTMLLDTAVLGTDAPDLRADAVAAFAYAQNWHLVLDHVPYAEAFDRPSPLLHLWSLAVEGQLYLLWPIVLVAVLGVLHRRLVVVVTLALAGLSAYGMAVLYDPDDVGRVYYGTDTRAAGFLVGAALALALWPRAVPRTPGRVLGIVLDVAGAGALVALLVRLVVTSEFDDALYQRGGFVGTALLTAVVIAAATRPRTRLDAVLGRAPMVWLGQRSYGIYLYHWPIFVLTRPGVDVPGPAWLVDIGRIAATLVVAEVSYRLVELPVRRGALRRWAEALRHGPRRSPAVGLAAVGLLAASLTLSCGPQVALPGTLVAAPARTATPPTPAPSTTPAAVATTPPATPPTTAAPTPRAAAPSATGAALVVGDSVVLGSADALESALGPGTTVDGKVGRQFDRGPAIVSAWTASHPGPVVVHLGSNGIVRDEDVAQIVDATRGRTLVFVNVAVPRRWQEPDNELLAQTAAAHPGQVVLVDWAALVTADPGLLGPDHVHPNQRGRAALAAAIRAGLTR